MIDLGPDKALVFRITHIANFPWILANGLHCRNSAVADSNYRDIGNPDLIQKRGRRDVPVAPGGTLSDYIPFYFTPYSPMLLNIKTGYNGLRQTPMREIVILVASLRDMARQGIQFLFTDRHAYLAACEFYNDLADLDRIDWAILHARDFKRDPNDPGKVERYQAEALVYRHLPVEALMGVICYGPEQRRGLETSIRDAGLQTRVRHRPDYYF